MSHRVLSITAIMVTLIVTLIVALALALKPADAAPNPTLSFTKTAESTGSELVYFTLRVDNNSPIYPDDKNSETSEDNGSGKLVIQDFLPATGDWYVLYAHVSDGDGNFSNITCEPSGNVLVCDIRNILGRHLNYAGDNFVYGFAEIKIYGILDHCGPVHNSALLFGGGAILPRSASADATFPCPVTPTPVIPTSTPTAAATTTVPNTPIPSATSTPIRIVPLPPNTGNTATVNEGASLSLTIALLGVVCILAIAIGWAVFEGYQHARHRMKVHKR